MRTSLTSVIRVTLLALTLLPSPTQAQEQEPQCTTVIGCEFGQLLSICTSCSAPGQCQCSYTIGTEVFACPSCDDCGDLARQVAITCLDGGIGDEADPLSGGDAGACSPCGGSCCNG